MVKDTVVGSDVFAARSTDLTKTLMMLRTNINKDVTGLAQKLKHSATYQPISFS